jgi:hypothetical protein
MKQISVPIWVVINGHSQDDIEASAERFASILREHEEVVDATVGDDDTFVDQTPD